MEKRRSERQVGIAAKSDNSAIHSDYADEKRVVGLFRDSHFAEKSIGNDGSCSMVVLVGFELPASNRPPSAMAPMDSGASALPPR